jgi:murein L,D-transpeptidase YafK
MQPVPNLRIVIDKTARLLTLQVGDAPQRRYPVEIGRNTAAHKCVEGDEATPLGEYYICAKNPRSQFFLSLCISYPNAADAERGLSAGLITAAEHAEILAAVRERRMPPQHTRLGGEIYLHGEAPRGAAPGTRGCIALSNAGIQELFELVPIGTGVSIRP